MAFDLLIVNGDIVDGTGAPRHRGEIGVMDGRIVHLARTAPSSKSEVDGSEIDDSGRDAVKRRAARVIDASGHVVAPGFVDLHSHADFSLQGAPQAATQLMQGVTTALVGNCGSSPFPARSLDDVRRDNAHLEAHFSDEWNDAAGCIAAFERTRPGINIALQVGLSAIRSFVLGADDRPPTKAEVRAMRREVATAAEAGVFGFSSGLIYAPGCYADQAEVTALVGEAAQRGLLYSTHMRNEAGGLLAAVDEAIATARGAGARLEISHLKAMGARHRGLPARALERIEVARQQGVDVATDVYPYTASSTRLTSRLPRFAMDGGGDALLSRLADPRTRAEIAARVAERFDQDTSPEGVFIVDLGPHTFGENHTWAVGLSLSQIGARAGCSPEEAALRLLHAHDGSVAIVNHAMDPDDVATVLAHPLVSVASDGWTLATQGEGNPHPRSFGTFARVLGHYVREEGLMPLEEAVRKMTSQPASRMGLVDRGVLAVGKVADITIFDAETVRENACYDDPWHLATGVSTVLLAGVPAVADGSIRSQRLGTVLRRGP